MQPTEILFVINNFYIYLFPAFPKGGTVPSARSRFWGACGVIQIYTTVSVLMVLVEIVLL